MNLSSIINIGTDHQIFSVANKVRMTNIISLFTALVSGLYTLNYIFILNNQLVAAINGAFTIAYLAPIIFNYFHAFRGSKVWFFCILMLHLMVCTNLYVTKDSGFHLYYFLVPTGAFLLFELHERIEKISLSVFAMLLFFFCENTLNNSPLIQLTETTNHLLYQSVIFIIMVEVVFVLTIFANQIELNEKKLVKQATTDALTEVANRHYFFEYGNNLLDITKNNNRPFTVVLLDFDFFKQINDHYGHNVGDTCLVEISKLITGYCRRHDLFARIGGEEFAIIMPETTAQEANNLAERLRVAIANHTIPVYGEKHFSCTISIGIASKSSTANDTLKNLLIKADKALYKAKELGRNRVQLYS